MIVAESVSYEYPRVRALTDVSFSLEAGAIAALIGPNGSGKTTLLRCLAALEKPFSGTINIDGLDTAAHPRKVHRKIGYLSDFFGLYADLTVDQCLQYAALAGGVRGGDVQSAVDKAAARVGLAERLPDVAGTLSRGLKQRLGIAQAMIHEPAVLLLDEPASGLDPEARHSLSQLFVELREQGTTLLVSSHILSELEDYATEVLFIRDGRVVQHAPVSDEMGDRVKLRIDVAEPVADLGRLLLAVEGLDIVEQGDTHAIVVCGAAPDIRQALLEKLVAAGVPVSGFGVARERLQDSYLSFVERSGDAS